MKSAWELALERTGGALNELPADKKEQLSEIDRIYRAKNAAADIAAQEKIRHAAGNPEALRQIIDDLSVEKASNDSKMQQEKEKIRKR